MFCDINLLQCTYIKNNTVTKLMLILLIKSSNLCNQNVKRS